MANMSYCKFENTYKDLRDCYEDFEEAESESEQKYRRLLTKLCEKIIDDYGYSYGDSE